MPALSVSVELYGRVMALTNPLIGVEEVLTRLLDGVNSPPRGRTRLRRRGSSVPRTVFVDGIFAVLLGAGGSLPTASVRPALWERLKSQLDASMRAPVASDHRDPRWWNHARFARQWMVEEGFVRKGQHGVWTLTSSGRAEALRRGAR